MSEKWQSEYHHVNWLKRLGMYETCWIMFSTFKIDPDEVDHYYEARRKRKVK